jgi:HK97 family phage portal protein
MSLLDDIRQRISNAILPSGKRLQRPYQSYSGYRQVASIPQGNELAMSLRGTVFACLQHRANALSAIQFNTFKEHNFTKSELGNDNWAAHLIANPNPYFTRSQVFSFIENWLSINGNCFIWTPTIGYKVPLQMWVLNPTRVRVIMGGDNFVQGYTYQSISDGLIPIPENEVIHLARVHPAARPDEIVGMNMFGVGLVTAALDYANIDVEVSEYLHRLFANNAVPPLIATFPERFDIEEWHKLKSSWNEELPDYKLRALLGGGMQLQLPPKSELGINYDSVSKDTRAQIAQVFGVPPGMLTGEFQNRATAEVQFAIFRQNTIDPEAIYIAEEFTRHFRRFEEDILIEPVPYAYADPEMDMRKEEFELKWGIKTINDARKERGYDAVEGGNVPLIGSGLVPLSISTEPKPIAPVPKLANRSLNLVTANAKDLFWRNYDTLTTATENELKIVVSGMVNTLENQAFDIVRNEGISATTLDVTNEQLDLFDATVQEACDRVQQRLLIDLGLGIEDLTSQTGQEITALVNENSAKISDSIGVIRSEVQATLTANASKSSAELREILKQQFASLKTSRVNMIANTTAANVTSGMQYSVYKGQGYKMVWLTQRDGRVRPSHAAMEGQTQGEDGYFDVITEKKDKDGNIIATTVEKAPRPLGEGLSASNAVNCRCQLFPVEV